MNRKLYWDGPLYIHCYCSYFDWRKPETGYSDWSEPPDCDTEFWVETTLSDWVEGVGEIICPECGAYWEMAYEDDSMEIDPYLNPWAPAVEFGWWNRNVFGQPRVPDTTGSLAFKLLSEEEQTKFNSAPFYMPFPLRVLTREELKEIEKKMSDTPKTSNRVFLEAAEANLLAAAAMLVEINENYDQQPTRDRSSSLEIAQLFTLHSIGMLMKVLVESFAGDIEDLESEK